MAEPGTFYLTDFLARHFDRFVVKPLGLDRHPELRNAYFGNYRKLVYLSQTHDARLAESAAQAAARLELEFEHVHCGYGSLETSLATRLSQSVAPDPHRSQTSEPFAAATRDRTMVKKVLVLWRDIPSQLILQRGRRREKVMLSERFQEAIDRAAMRAGKGGSDAYLAEWRRETTALDGVGDLREIALAEANRFEDEFTQERLNTLIRSHGVEANT